MAYARLVAACHHPKPLFPTTGRQRKACLDCVPKPEPHPIQWSHVEQAACARPGCGQRFDRKLAHERYCSTDCRQKANNRKIQERRRNSEPRACGDCGTVFVPEYGSRRIRYCTVGCAKQAKNRQAKRENRIERLRGRAAVVRRARWLQLQPLCVECKRQGYTRAATQVDHVLALANGGTDTADNLQSLCDDCHRMKTARDLGYRQRHQVGLDGWPRE